MPEPAAASPLEAYVLLANGAKGAAAVGLIQQVLEAPGVYVFGELLDHPNIKDLESNSSTPNAKAFSLKDTLNFSTCLRMGLMTNICRFNISCRNYPSLCERNSGSLPLLPRLLRKRPYSMTIYKRPLESKVFENWRI